MSKKVIATGASILFASSIAMGISTASANVVAQAKALPTQTVATNAIQLAACSGCCGACSGTCSATCSGTCGGCAGCCGADAD